MEAKRRALVGLAAGVGLRERGYVEGKTIAIEYRWAEGRYERLGALVSGVVDSIARPGVAIPQPLLLRASRVAE